MALGDDLSLSISAGGVQTVATPRSSGMLDLGLGGELELQQPFKGDYFAGVYAGGGGSVYRIPDSDHPDGRGGFLNAGALVGIGDSSLGAGLSSGYQRLLGDRFGGLGNDRVELGLRAHKKFSPTSHWGITVTASDSIDPTAPKEGHAFRMLFAVRYVFSDPWTY